MNQGQLFDEPVAENYDEAEAFLEDCMAEVVDSLKKYGNILRKAVWTWMECPMKNWRNPARYFLCREEDI